MRKFLMLIFLIFSVGYGQNKQVLYDFAGLPQTLLLNPGTEVGYKSHVGVPFLSQISLQGGFTGFSTYDIFADNGIDINVKIRDVLANNGKSEFVAVNQQLEILSGGFRLPNKNYLSFGYYEEFEALAKIPKDLVDLYENNVVNKHYSVNKLAFRAEMLGVLHVGLSKKLNDKWQIGARAKIYSGMFHVKSKQNSGALMPLRINNTYSQQLENVNLLMQTSGIFLDSGETVDDSYVKKNLLFGGNLGLGFDVGFTHHLDKQWAITGSIQDFGFVYNTKNVESYSIKGDYEIEGIELAFDLNNPEDYWTDLEDDFNEKIVLDTIYDKYISFRPVKLNGVLSYSFGQTYDDCRFLIDPESFNNKIGFQWFSTIGTVHSYMAATVFFERKINKYFRTKLTYTADPYSFSNIGIGLSTQIGLFNAYFTADNLLNLNNVYAAKSASFQLGINFIFKEKN
ncbi:MAG: hypothetical protein JJE44_07165 [Flavobacteriaceae bacterium]|nr:hypothetical protein [Flavobacteriaceae bacterium]